MATEREGKLLKELSKIIRIEVGRFWYVRGGYLIADQAFGYAMDKEDLEQEVWLRVLEFLKTNRFKGLSEEEILQKYSGLLWKKIRFLLMDVVRQKGAFPRKWLKIYRLKREGKTAEEISQELNLPLSYVSRALSFAIIRIDDHECPDRLKMLGTAASPEEQVVQDLTREDILRIANNGVLTRREKQVIQGLLEGKAPIQLARELGLSPSAISLYYSRAVHSIRQALGIKHGE